MTSDPDLYVVGTKEKLPVQVRLLDQVIISDGDLEGREEGREGGREGDGCLGDGVMCLAWKR